MLRSLWSKRPPVAERPTRARDYAREALAAGQRPLILTHTHAACAVFAERTKGVGHGIEIRTIDSVIAGIASAYHAGLGLPSDIGSWVRAERDGHVKVASKVAALLERRPMIAMALARRHGVVVCDEHQDASGDKHAVAMALFRAGAKLRVFADPMQKIFREPLGGHHPAWDWNELTRQAHAFEDLDHPHRWNKGCRELGQWTLRAARRPQGRSKDRLARRPAAEPEGRGRGESGSAESRVPVVD